ncbi:TIR domain-containing protein [Vibrio sp. M260121]|uniref:TIR domain-containing protein n=1 Tax=Vibrio sp. M260121 TaxID=3020897 RepID=UPI002F3E4495
MALFRESEIRARAQTERNKSTNIYKTSRQILNESFESFSQYARYDIFLSHSSKDAELILGVKATLEDLGYSVYVDWVDDPQLDRSNVDADTAELLRKRMSASKSLLYVTTENATTSKWMPWECGYFDGIKEKVAIAPIATYSWSNEFEGQEYLGLYPYCLKQDDNAGRPRLWIHKDKDLYLSFDAWLEVQRNQITWKRI